MKNTKKLYKLNAVKFIAKCKAEDIEPDYEWAFENDGAIVKFNDDIELGALNGKLIPLSICDEYKGTAIISETNTELEEALHHTASCAVADLCEAEEVIEELKEELEELKDFTDNLMKCHNNVMSVMSKHRDSLSEAFVEDMFKEVVSKVMTSIIENVM